MILSGILVGLTTSIRILGPYAAVIVILYGRQWMAPRRTLYILPAYGIIAAITCYLTWPYLWTDPLARFLYSIAVASQYPWKGGVLFEGMVVGAKGLPARYLPEMISIQLTEAAILLIISGIIVALTRIRKKEVYIPLILFLVWFVIPFAAILLAGSVVYDGFRQIIFLLPPLFLMTGFAFDWIFPRIRNITLRFLLMILIVAPGIYSIITLHPYEYIYYNSFVGGVQGAYKNYELEYWATSYREAALYLNEVAPPNSHVAVYGPVDIEVYSTYSRPDIQVNLWNVAKRLKETRNITYEYAVIVNRLNAIDNVCKDGKIIKAVERDGALLMIVKEIPPNRWIAHKLFILQES